MLTAVSALGVAGLTAAGGVATTVIGRRQPRASSRRDDFVLLTDQHRKEIQRLDRRVDELESEAEVDRERADRDRAKINGLDFALRYFVAWTRELVGYSRRAGLEPPLPPQPIPPEVQPYMHDVGV
jgi:hypothetical protein